MCGLVGYSTTADDKNMDTLSAVARQAAIRGLHAFGAVYYDSVYERLNIIKEHCLDNLLYKLSKELFQDCILHMRYSTSGDWRDHANNQPVTLNGISVAFNGVISMKTKDGMEEEYGIDMQTDNDGELFLRHLLDGGDPIDFIADMEGSFAGIWYEEDGARLHACRNMRRPLWYVDYGVEQVYTSTRDIIKRAFGDNVAALAQECRPNTLYTLVG